MRYPRKTEQEIRRLHICYENSTDKKYDLKCIEEAYKNKEMNEFEYEYAKKLLK